jgi:hypothetical protein
VLGGAGARCWLAAGTHCPSTELGELKNLTNCWLGSCTRTASPPVSVGVGLDDHALVYVRFSRRIKKGNGKSQPGNWVRRGFEFDLLRGQGKENTVVLFSQLPLLKLRATFRETPAVPRAHASPSPHALRVRKRSVFLLAVEAPPCTPASETGEDRVNTLKPYVL